MVFEQANLKLNWLPMSQEEAEYLAFGSRVPLDALPAYVVAVRLCDGNPNFNTAPNMSLLPPPPAPAPQND